METSLLIGNGLNRTLGNFSISWDALIRDIANENDIEYIDNLSLPLEFESVVNGILKNQIQPTDKLYLDLKKRIATKVKDVRLPHNAIHNRIKDLNVNNILTTNYDYLLEQVFDSDYHYEGDKKNKYLFEKISAYQNVKIFHIHGFAGIPNSICLGYEHYVGLTQNIRSKIHSKEELRIKALLKGEMVEKEYWVDKFFTSDMYILGLGLTESEIDLWWLLTFRASLFYSNREGLRSKINNRIVYYDIIDNIPKNDLIKNHIQVEINDEQQRKLKLLSNELVEVKTYKLGDFDGDYRLAYESILNNIRYGG